ncbi:MAG: helix-turn-helix domain-containing protein [Thermoplasmatota archaeon]
MHPEGVAANDLQELLRLRQGHYMGAECRLALACGDGETTPSRLIGGLISFQTSAKIVGEKVLDYGELKLVRFQLSVEEALDAIHSLMESEPKGKTKMKIRDLDISLSEPLEPIERDNYHGGPRTWPYPALASRQDLGPLDLFCLRIRKAQYLDPFPIMFPGVPTMVDKQKRVEEWVEPGPGRAIGAGHQNARFWIALPSITRFVDRVELNDRNLLVHLNPGDYVDSYALKIAAVHDDALEDVEEPVSEKESMVDVQLAGWPDRLWIALISTNGAKVVDWYSFDPLGPTESRVVVVVAEEVVHELIEFGEDDETEFKTNATPQNHHDVLETIVAFSNHLGGRILFGVDDHGAIKGVEGPENIARKVENWAASNIEPGVAVRTHVAEAEGKKLVIAHVDEGVQKPYQARHNGAFYIRRGATDRAISRAELDEIYSKKPSAQESFLGRRLNGSVLPGF